MVFFIHHSLFPFIFLYFCVFFFWDRYFNASAHHIDFGENGGMKFLRNFMRTNFECGLANMCELDRRELSFFYVQFFLKIRRRTCFANCRMTFFFCLNLKILRVNGVHIQEVEINLIFIVSSWNMKSQKMCSREIDFRIYIQKSTNISSQSENWVKNLLLINQGCKRLEKLVENYFDCSNNYH